MIVMEDVGHAVFYQCFLNDTALRRGVHLSQGHIVFAIPMVDGRVIRCDVIGNIVVEVAGAVGVRVNEEAPDGFQLKEVVDGVAQQQSARLAHAIGLVAQRVGIGSKQAGDLPAGGIGQHRVVLGLNMELFRVLCDVPHGPAHIFQRGVVCRLVANAVPQHKAGIAQLVEPLRRGNTLTHLGAGVDGVAANDQHELAAGITAPGNNRSPLSGGWARRRSPRPCRAYR